MPNYTTNLNLEKPLQGEFYNVDVFNSNYDKIDTAIGEISTNSYQKPTGGIPLTDVSSQITDRLDWYGNATGIGNLFLNIPQFVGTLKIGTVLRFKTESGGNGVFTLNFNGNGAKNIKRPNGSNVNRLEAGGVYTVVYDGANFILQGEGGSGNALSSEILQGRTATTDNGEITGTMPNRGTYNQTINAESNLVLPSGYYSGLNITSLGKRYASGTTPLFYDGVGLVASVNSLPFQPRTVILTFSLNGNNVRKVFNNGASLDSYSYDSSGNINLYGGWNIGTGYFNTRVLNGSYGTGTNCEYLVFS